jgi:DNA-binding GntR family transcriptional regulator
LNTNSRKYYFQEILALIIEQSSISEKAYEILANLIIENKLQPGERLPEEQLAKNLGISRTPLREAMSRLVKDGLITLSPRKGAHVSTFQLDDVMEVYDIRMVLEGLAARLAAPHLDPEILNRLRGRFAGKDMEALIQADTELHDLVIRHCGNRRLQEFLGALHNLIQVFRVSGYGSAQRSVRATSDHLAMIDALLNHDGESAERLMKDHIQWAQNEIVERINNEKDKNTRLSSGE